MKRLRSMALWAMPGSGAASARSAMAAALRAGSLSPFTFARHRSSAVASFLAATDVLVLIPPNPPESATGRWSSRDDPSVKPKSSLGPADRAFKARDGQVARRFRVVRAWLRTGSMAQGSCLHPVRQRSVVEDER